MKRPIALILLIMVALTGCVTTKPKPYKTTRAKPINTSHHTDYSKDHKIEAVSLPNNSPINQPDHYNTMIFAIFAGAVCLVSFGVPILEFIERRKLKRKGN